MSYLIILECLKIGMLAVVLASLSVINQQLKNTRKTGWYLLFGGFCLISLEKSFYLSAEIPLHSTDFIVTELISLCGFIGYLLFVSGIFYVLPYGSKLSRMVHRYLLKKQKKQVNIKANSELLAQETLARLNELIKTSPLAVMEWDEKGIIHRWSLSAEKIFGYSEAEILGRNIFEVNFIYEEDSEHVLKVKDRLLMGIEQNNICVNRNYSKDKRIIFCEWHNSVQPATDNYPLSVLSFAQDITEREEHHQALHNSEEKFRQVTEHLNEVCYVVDLQSQRIIYVNAAFEQVWGIPVQQLLTNPHVWLDAVHPEDKKYVKTLFFNDFFQEKNLTYHQAEYRLLKANGDIYWVRDKCYPVIDRNGHVYRLVGIAEDVTYYKNTENTLREQQELLSQRNIELSKTYENLQFHIDNSPFAIVEWDAEGQISYWSTTAEKMFGWYASEMLGKSLFEVDWVHQADIRVIKILIKRLICREMSTIMHISRHYTKEKQLLFCEWHVSVRLDEQGQILSLLSFALDVTLREQLRLTLQYSEEQFRQLAEHIEEVFYIFDIEQNKLLYISPSHEKIWGQSTKDLLQNPALWAEIIHPDDRNMVEKAFRRFQQGGEFIQEYRIIRVEDKEIRWIRDRSYPIYNATGQLYRVVGIAEDVSDYKYAEIALKQSKVELQQRNFEIRELYEFTQQLNYRLNMDEVLRIFYEYLYRLIPAITCSCFISNDTNSYQLFIASREKLSPTLIQNIREEVFATLTSLNPHHGITAEEIPIVWLKQYSLQNTFNNTTLLSSRLNIPLEKTTPTLQNKAKPSSILWLGTVMKDAFTHNQLRLCYIFINHLANTFKRIQEVFIKEQRDLQSIVMYLPIGVVLFDKKAKILFVNQQAQQYFPFLIDDNKDYLAEKIFNPLLYNTNSEQNYLNRQYINIENLFLELTTRQLDYGSYSTHYLMVIQDITEQKKIESALKAERVLLAQQVEKRTAALSDANLELAKANRLKDEFLASMSHELRTPLNAILGMSEALNEEVYGKLNEKQHKFLHHIHESGQHLLALINDILDLSKIEAGKVQLMLDTTNIAELCQSCLTLIKQQAENKKLHVHFHLDGQAQVIYADQRRLKQILLNLLSNAVKFTAEGGDIGLEVEHDAEKQAIHFIIWDKGIGIDNENMQQLFKPFTQLDSRLSRQYEGTGLGLVLVHRLTELHGGSIKVESQAGQGSRFTVSLPAVSEKWRAYIQSEDPQIVLKPPSTINATIAQQAPLILIAEDHLNNILVLIDYLMAHGYRVNTARTGTEALEQLHEETPHLILMDVQMPGMDGIEATRQIRLNAQFASLPIIAMTALTMPGDREQCLAAGMNDYISKPFALKQLLNLIQQYLGVKTEKT
ncbi:PAS domain S-box protein [Beggiatoa leptomitoformis]|uniref:histidine kinase n=1 Tax=Beggiatoa leptomitoformis TaxID=288004 RepID=A0A2N9YEJ7_9GAMM|nr:PAS domain S-box protein [Beggiatoa leptomitoformis]AUI68913.2 PAS domain S-box protein [Beggiatoa leptomitoformis]QGX03781.1 PAS domain S-box protein [Beggiatoa leptomitoformis]